MINTEEKKLLDAEGRQGNHLSIFKIRFAIFYYSLIFFITLHTNEMLGTRIR